MFAKERVRYIFQCFQATLFGMAAIELAPILMYTYYFYVYNRLSTKPLVLSWAMNAKTCIYGLVCRVCMGILPVELSLNFNVNKSSFRHAPNPPIVRIALLNPFFVRSVNQELGHYLISGKNLRFSWFVVVAIWFSFQKINAPWKRRKSSFSNYFLPWGTCSTKSGACLLLVFLTNKPA